MSDTDLQYWLARYPNIHFFEQGNQSGLAIKNAFCEARFLFQGAQLIHFKPLNKQPWLWLGKDADFSGKEALRGGIPVCAPWFGKLDRNPLDIRNLTRGPAPPNHGFFRNEVWSLVSVEETQSETVLCFELNENNQTKIHWPYRFISRIEYVLGETLTVNFSYKNLSETELALSCALHSYFLVSDIGLVFLKGLENCAYIDALDFWRSHNQSGDVMVDRPVDRIYQNSPSSLELEDQGWGRTLQINSFNSRSTVVWNPWQEGKNMSQVAEGDFLKFLCVETANVLDDYVCLGSGETHQLSLSVSEKSSTKILPV